MRLNYCRIVGIAVGFALMLVGTCSAKSLRPQAADTSDDFEEATDSLPPGMKERVFIHLPRTHQPNHLGTCTPTVNDAVNDFGLAGWRLPSGGIDWYLNEASVPSTVGVTAAINALNAAFGTWTNVDPGKTFNFRGNTTANRPRLDFVNTVMWGRVSGGAIAITHVRYYTATGIIADVDTVFNNRYPWAVFDGTSGTECQTSPDAYDVQNIGTHEFGHWTGLDDLYSTGDVDLTMYGYGAGGELKKRTLGTGDISGTNAIAP